MKQNRLHSRSWRLVGLFFPLIIISGMTSIAQSSGIISTFAGNGAKGFSGDGDPAISAKLNGPRGVEVDSSGNVYIADTGNNRIRKVTPGGVITTVAGTGSAGYQGDGGPARLAFLNAPEDVAVDRSGNLYIADSLNSAVRKVDSHGVISTVGRLPNLKEIAVDTGGTCYLADASTVFKLAGGMEPSVIAGGGTQHIQDGADARSVFLEMDKMITGIELSPAGDLYIAIIDLVGGYVLKVDSEGRIRIIAGGGSQDPKDGPPATAATVNPLGIAFDAAGNIYCADMGSFQSGSRSNVILKIAPNGRIEIIAGTGEEGFSGDGGKAILAKLSSPADVAVDSAGNIYIADLKNERIRKVVSGDPSVIITYFPQLAFGDGWSTRFAFVNTGLSEATGRLSLHDPQGNPLPVSGLLTGASGVAQSAGPSSFFTFVIPPGGTIFLSTATEALLVKTTTGWAQLESSGSISGVAIYEHASGENLDSVVSALPFHPTQLAVLPLDLDRSAGTSPAYAIANPGGQEICISIVLMNQDGSLFDSTTVALAPGQQVSRYPFQDFPLSAPNIFKGSLAIRAQNGQAFVAFGFIAKKGIFAALPVIDFQ